MATTLFAGQQYLWDNRASFGSQTAERGTDNAETEANAAARYNALAGQVDNGYSACFTINAHGYTSNASGVTYYMCDNNAAACPSGWTETATWGDCMNATWGISFSARACCLPR